jgi:hypothetical protein
MLARSVLLVTVIVASFGAVWVAGRAGRHLTLAGLPGGFVVVTGPDCRWCERLLTALARRHPGQPVSVIDVEAAGRAGITVRSVPTALVVADGGRVVMRRSGPAAFEDLDRLVGEVSRL